MKGKVFFLGKIIISIFLIWYFLSRLNIHDLTLVLLKTNIRFLVAAIFFTGLTWFVSAIRWRYILKMIQVDISPVTLFLYNLIGNFYGIILPGGKVAGDIMCAYRFTRDSNAGNDGKKYFLSVFADRFLGMLTMLIFLSIYALIRHPIIHEVFGSGSGIISILFIALALGGSIIMFSRALDSGLKWLQKIPIVRWRAMNESFITALGVARNHGRESAIAFGISVLAVFINMMAIYMVTLSIGLHIDFFRVGFSFLASTLLISIPITIAGIGLRENSNVYILARAGAPIAEAAGVSVLALLVFIMYAGVGGILELYTVMTRKKGYVGQ